MSDFPLGVGSRWVYLIQDSTFDYRDPPLQSVRSDSFVVSVQSRTVLSDSHQIAILFCSYSDRTDTVAVDITPDRVTMAHFHRIFSSPDGHTKDAEFLFPLQIGRSWGIGHFLHGDTSLVAGKDSISVPAGSFPNAFHIMRADYNIGPSSGDWFDIWFVPKLGIVGLHHWELELGTYPTAVGIRLKTYHLVGLVERR